MKHAKHIHMQNTSIHIHLNTILPSLEDSINQGDGELQNLWSDMKSSFSLDHWFKCSWYTNKESSLTSNSCLVFYVNEMMASADTIKSHVYNLNYKNNFLAYLLWGQRWKGQWGSRTLVPLNLAFYIHCYRM